MKILKNAFMDSWPFKSAGVPTPTVENSTYKFWLLQNIFQYIEKYMHVCGHIQFKPMFFKGSLTIFTETSGTQRADELPYVLI